MCLINSVLLHILLHRQTILDAWKQRAAVDGLNSLDYELLSTDSKNTFLHLTLNIDQRKMIRSFETKFMQTLVPPTVYVPPPGSLQEQESWKQFLSDEENSQVQKETYYNSVKKLQNIQQFKSKPKDNHINAKETNLRKLTKFKFAAKIDFAFSQILAIR